MAPVPSRALKLLWTKIEEFLDFPETVAVAQTCRQFRDEIIDAETGLFKVSHLTVVEDYARRGEELDDKPWNNIPHYVPNALNAIHMPSVRRITMTFPYMRSRNGDVDVDVLWDTRNTCFVILAMQLAHASRLESLKIRTMGILSSPNLTVDQEYHFPATTLMNIEIFGRNLAKCKCLNELSIYLPNDNYDIHVARDFILALTPTVAKRKDTLRRIGIAISHEASPREVENRIQQSFKRVAVDFFQIVLQCTQLEALELYFGQDELLSDALLDAAVKNSGHPLATAIHKKQKVPPGDVVHTGLRRLRIGIHGMYWALGISTDDDDRAGRMEGAKALLGHFADCCELQLLDLGLPQSIWNTHLGKIAGIVDRNQKLSDLNFYFGKCKDNDGKILEFLSKTLIHGGCRNVAEMLVHGVDAVEGKSMVKLIRDFKGLGGACLYDYDEENQREEGACNSFDKSEKIDLMNATDEVPLRIDIIGVTFRHKENFGQVDQKILSSIFC